MQITFDIWNIVSCLPFVGGIVLLTMHRKWFWESRRALATISSIVGILVGSGVAFDRYLDNADNRAREAKITKNLAEQACVAAMTEEERSEELSKQKIAREEKKTKEERYLPAEWGELYAALNDCTFWEAKLQLIESFPRRYSPDLVPPLPGPGFNMILDTVSVEKHLDQTWKHIHRARKALQLYITPFPDADIQLASQGKGGGISLALNQGEGAG